MSKTIIYNLFFAFLFTISSAFLSGISYQDYLGIIIVFVISFWMLTIWTYFMNAIKPRRITKEDDEILHPSGKIRK